jgi:3-dehydroquinate dehydratase-1
LTTRICVSILPKTIAEATISIEKAEQSHADFVEVRLDRLKNSKGLADLATTGRMPKIATNKKASISEMERAQTLFNAAKSGFAYVDLDVQTPKLGETIMELAQLGTKPIVSFHYLTGTPTSPELESILETEIASNAEVCKIVTTAKTMEDNLTLLSFTSKASQKAKIVCFAMGEQGKISRLLSPLFGAFFTFATLEHGSETASGQMAIQEMRLAYRLLGFRIA